MTNIVFLEPNKMDSEPFTTSDVIAGQTGVTHRYIREAIQKYKAEMETFGILVANGTFIPERKRGRGQPQKIYKLNEQQATFLMTLLKNTPVVVRFKQELVRQFYAMREELMNRKINRAAIVPARLCLTDAIRDHYPDSPHKRFVYKHFQDLVYKMAFGMTAAQVRKQRNAPKNTVAADYLTASEMEAVREIDYRLAALVAMGLLYEQVKEMACRRIAA